jgi:Tfp pilus assembly protein PilN
VRAVNLIPSEQRRGASVGAGRSGGAAYAVLALVASLAVLALLYGIAHHQIGSRQAQATELTAKAQQAQAQAAQLAPYTTFVAMRQARIQAVTQLVDSRFDWAHAFHELGRVLPHDASVVSLTGTVGSTSGSGAASSSPSGSKSSSGGSVSSATPPGTVPVFVISGCAASQSAVAETINRLRLIDGVSTVTLQSSTKATSSGQGAGGAAGAGGCASSAPQYTVLVAFQPLPAAGAGGARASTVAASGASSATGASNTAGAGR